MRPRSRPAAPRSALRGAQPARQILDQVVGVLEPDRKADRARGDPRLGERRVAHAEMRRARRMDHERLGVADVGEVRKNPEGLDETPARRAIALEAEAENGTAAAR